MPQPKTRDKPKPSKSAITTMKTHLKPVHKPPIPVLVQAPLAYAPPKTLAKTTIPVPPRTLATPQTMPHLATVPAGFARVQAGMKLRRNAIATMPLDGKYEVVRTIDSGDGTKGGMNAGIFVVRKRSTRELFIQKNFKFDDDFLVQLVKKEIIIMRALKCNSLVSQYCTEQPGISGANSKLTGRSVGTVC